MNEKQKEIYEHLKTCLEHSYDYFSCSYSPIANVLEYALKRNPFIEEVQNDADFIPALQAFLREVEA